MILNMTINGSSSTKSTIIVSTTTGSDVGIYDSTYTTLIKPAIEKSSGEYWFTGLNNGIYYIKAELNNDATTLTQEITEYGVYRVKMLYRTIPEFTYTDGTYEIVQDDDTIINNSDIPTYKGNWKIRFLTSGTLQFSNLQSAENGIDIFLVGGGGGGGTGTANGGGGGGYTFTQKNKTITTNTAYPIVVGDGGTAKNIGGTSSAFSLQVLGGRSVSSAGRGGDGGSGGGAGTNSSDTSDHTKWGGGSDGSGGYNNGTEITEASHGQGQGITTREFGEANATLYAGGGGAGVNIGSNGRVAQYGGEGGGGNGAGKTSGGSIIQATAGTSNTGGGGGGGGYNNTSDGAAGGSGIVIIRNARL